MDGENRIKIIYQRISIYEKLKLLAPTTDSPTRKKIRSIYIKKAYP